MEDLHGPAGTCMIAAGGGRHAQTALMPNEVSIWHGQRNLLFGILPGYVTVTIRDRVSIDARPAWYQLGMIDGGS
jgi:hypothetical protein